MSRMFFVLGVFFAISLPLKADEANLSGPNGLELFKIQNAFETAAVYNKLELLTPYLDEGFQAKMISGEVLHGPEGIRKFWQNMYSQVKKGQRVSSYELKLNPQELHVSGDLARAKGRSDEIIQNDFGEIYKFHTNWDASLKKQDGSWKLASMNAHLEVRDKVSLALQAIAQKLLLPPLKKLGLCAEDTKNASDGAMERNYWNDLRKISNPNPEKKIPDYDQDKGRAETAKRSGSLGLASSLAIKPAAGRRAPPR
ncbi:MAG: hypothetical protein HY747_07195 [Elusimicrobia bacterium]|nr:hypothetical protein [Elusimicrobiota bacterium]